jgi:hypothetical protein
MKRMYEWKLKMKSQGGSTGAVARDKWFNDPRVNQDVKRIIQLHGKYVEERKFFSQYANMQVDSDNRVRYQFKQSGVAKAPGRMSSSKTLWGTGANMQNQPRRSQEFYVADEGTVLIYFDLAQAEARIVAYRADIPKWKEDFERARLDGSYDCHRALASDMFKVPYELVPEDDWDDDKPTMRYISKRCRHGLNYTLNWPALAQQTGLPLYESKKAYIIYHNESPEVKKWWDEQLKQARKTREIYNALGRRYKIIGQKVDNSILGNLVAFYPQSTIGDKVKQIWYQCHEDPRWDINRMRWKLNVHDALIGLAKPEFAEVALSIAKEYAEAPIMVENIYGTSVEPCIIPADFKISQPDEKGIHRWSTLKGVEI